MNGRRSNVTVHSVQMSSSDGEDDRLDGTAAAFGTAASARSFATSAPARCSAYMIKQSNWLCLIAAVIATGCCGWVFGQITPKTADLGVQLPPLDGRFLGYSTADVETLFSAYGAAGREQYTRFELLDLAICIISYATALSTGISMLARALPPGWPKQQLQLANLLPWAAAAADVVENVLILAMLVSYPKLVVMLAPCAAAATCTKWVLLMAAIAAFGVTSLLAFLLVAGREVH